MEDATPCGASHSGALLAPVGLGFLWYGASRNRRCTPRTRAKEFHDRSRAIGRTGYIRRLEILRSYDIRDRLPEIETRTLFLAADQDHLVASVDEARTMATRMSNASVKVLEGLRHICLVSHDFDLRSVIEPWLADCVL